MTTKPNLRTLFVRLQALPNYCGSSNNLSVERAAEIAAEFDSELEDFRPDFDQANNFSQSPRATADTRGAGLGMFNNAEKLFFGYVYDAFQQGACESQEAARREDGDE